MTADLRALLAKATPGPWEAIKGVEENDDMRCGISAVRGSYRYLVATIENGAPGDFCDTEFANAALIVTLRNNASALLDEIEAKDARIAKLEAVLERCAIIVERNLGRQDEKVTDVALIARQVLSQSPAQGEGS